MLEPHGRNRSIHPCALHANLGLVGGGGSRNDCPSEVRMAKTVIARVPKAVSFSPPSKKVHVE